MGDAPRRPDANRHAVVMVAVRHVGARHAVPQPFWATHRVAPTRWATHRVAPTRWTPRPDGRRTASPRREPACRGDGCGTAGGVRHVGATRRVALTRWATHRVAPTRWVALTRWATHRVAPTRWAMHHVAPTRTGVPW
ncbi:MAG: hypothetical protein D6823_07325 [Chloroflexi bacterium]|nr:MAG: hypothetical protein D6823_07325 [Chloroflexota bacterium]